MFKFLKRIWVVITGKLIQAGDDVVSSGPEAIKATYATAIHEVSTQFKEMQEGLALLMQQTNRTKNIIKQMETTEADLISKVHGAAALSRSDPDNKLHKEAGSRYLVRLDEIRDRKEDQENELKSLTQMIEEYKIQMSAVKGQIEDLKHEEAIIMADFLSAQNALKIEEKLSGVVTSSSSDESLVAIRDKVQALKARAQALSSFRNTDLQTDMYAEIGKEQSALSRFEELITSDETTEGVRANRRSLGE